MVHLSNKIKVKDHNGLIQVSRLRLHQKEDHKDQITLRVQAILKINNNNPGQIQMLKVDYQQELMSRQSRKYKPKTSYIANLV